MPDKAYTILYAGVDEDSGYLVFPIKRTGRAYAGMPQFFGGTKNAGESNRETIARELSEESDGKLTLKSGGLKQVYSTTVGPDRYSFYVAENFSGSHYIGSLKNAEMQSITRFLVQTGNDSDMEDLMNSLKIVPSEAFSDSQTYAAFESAITWAETA